MKRVCCHPRASRGFGSLIELMVVALLILGGMALYFGMMGGGKKSATERALDDPTGTTTAIGMSHQLEGATNNAPYGHAAEGVSTATNTRPVQTNPNVRVPTTIPGRAIYKAHGEQCGENLRQLRMMIQMYAQENNDTFPKSLTDVDGSYQVRTCPISKQDYIYDPSTGKVYCNTPGHENL